MSVRPVMEIVIGSGLSCDLFQWETLCGSLMKCVKLMSEPIRFYSSRRRLLSRYVINTKTHFCTVKAQFFVVKEVRVLDTKIFCVVVFCPNFQRTNLEVCAPVLVGIQ